MAFCSRCGKELKDGASFCTGCGEKVTEAAGTIVKSSVGQINISENGRIESSDDRELNNKLFKYYESLIKPMKSYETTEAHISRLKDKIARLSVRGPIAVKLVISAFINVFVASFFFRGVLDEADKLIVNINPSIRGIIVIFTMFGIIPTFVLFIYILSEMDRIKKRKAAIEELDKAEKLLADQGAKLVPHMKHVPPICRCSEALSYITNAYNNSMVDNLKEAVNGWNEERRNMQMIDAFAQVQYEVISSISQMQFYVV